MWGSGGRIFLLPHAGVIFALSHALSLNLAAVVLRMVRLTRGRPQISAVRILGVPFSRSSVLSSVVTLPPSTEISGSEPRKEFWTCSLLEVQLGKGQFDII